MAFQNVHGKEMRLVLSSDAKPRLKWTHELHQKFVDAIDRLGGAEKATPKSLMRVMGIDGLTLYHLKSHLQKYRTAKSQKLQTCHQYKEEECGEKQRSHFSSKNPAKEYINESLQITRALQMQMEVQRKLHEQIEVQKHLQLRIEAQRKYFQSVLKKAQETISEYSSCSIEVEQAKDQLSQLLSMVDSDSPNSSFSVLTQSEGSMAKHENDNKFFGHYRCSLESSLTSSESSWKNKGTPTNNEFDENFSHENGKMKKEMFAIENSESKRMSYNIDDVEVNDTEQSASKRMRLLENIDLNCKFQE